MRAAEPPSANWVILGLFEQDLPESGLVKETDGDPFYLVSVFLFVGKGWMKSKQPDKVIKSFLLRYAWPREMLIKKYLVTIESQHGMTTRRDSFPKMVI